MLQTRRSPVIVFRGLIQYLTIRDLSTFIMKSRISTFALSLVLTMAAHAPASLVVYEGFDVAGMPSGNLFFGQAGATSFGFDAAGWGNPSASSTYQSAGLSFGSGGTTLATVGGSARLLSFFGGSSGRISRGLDVNVTGTVWGSYLALREVSGPRGDDADAMHAMINQSATGHDNNSEMVFSVEEYQSNLGGLRGKDNTLPTFPNYNTGNPIVNGVTYLVLFKATNLGGATGATDLKEWVLTSDQFDNFKLTGLTEAELDAATVGSLTTNVLQKGSESYTPGGAYPRLTTADFFVLLTFDGLIGWFDELRLSNALTGGAGGGLDQVTPLNTVPEAGAFLFLAGAGCVAGLAVKARRRWMGRFA
jgi:hypothetical protein